MGKGFDLEAWEARGRVIRETAEARDIAEMDAEEPERFGYCYFIGCAEGLVKIGYSMSPVRRLNQLKSSSPYKLELLALANGGTTREAYYHRKFDDHAVGGEWFNLAPEILMEIDRLTAVERPGFPIAKLVPVEAARAVQVLGLAA